MREEDVQLCGQARVGVLDPGARCPGHQGLVELCVRVGDLAPIGGFRSTGANERVETVVHRGWQPAVVAFEGETARFDFECGAQLEEGDEVGGASRVTEAPRFGTIRIKPSLARVRRAARRVWRETS